MKIRIVYENMKSKSAKQLVLNIIDLLTFMYLPVRQNSTSIRERLRYSKLKNCWTCLGKSGCTNKKVSVSVYSPDCTLTSNKKSFQTAKWLKKYHVHVISYHEISSTLRNIMQSNGSIAFLFQIDLFQDMTFHRMITRAIVGKSISRESNDKVS